MVDLFSKGEHGSRNLPFLLTKRSKFEKLVVGSLAQENARHWSLSGTPQFNGRGEFAGFRGSGVDVTEHRRSAEHAARLAMYDSLTGLPNRLRMTEVLESNIAASSGQNSHCAVMMLDLDRFKQVNDTLGHPAGDELLKQVADRLYRMVGDKERIFRLGGDEFQIVVQEMSEEALRELGNRIIQSLSQPYAIFGSRCIIGASVGTALCPSHGRTSDDLIRNADLALYAAKASGRGCIKFFSEDLLKTAEDRRVLESDLRDALGNGEIHVFYQPIVNAATNLTTGVEALVRWHHPERGSISPAIFVPIAEEADLIGPLGEWILRKACEDAASWPGKLRVAVNVSPIQFTSGSLPAIVTSALASSGLSPDRLELEITEGVFLGDWSSADTIFASLKQIGVRLALDDFGTGYSSLGYLRTAPFDKIKIDQSFVRSATLPGSRNAAIIAAIVALARALGMETTAEGIESHDQLALIQSLQVSHVQGYIYSQAIASDELRERLETGEWVISPVGPSKQRSERVSMYRKVRAIFGNHYRSVLIRNLSETGALVEGLDDVPFGSQLIIDFGEGHLVFGSVNRARNRQQALVFEEPLISDGRGGLRTARPISPVTLSKAALPAGADPSKPPAPQLDNGSVLNGLRTRLGLAPAPSISLGELDGGSAESSGTNSVVNPGFNNISQPSSPTVGQLMKDYLADIRQDRSRHAKDAALLNDQILPTFGEKTADEVSSSLVGEWLRSKSVDEGVPSATIAALSALFGQLYLRAVQTRTDGAAQCDLEVAPGSPRRDVHERPLTSEEVARLTAAAVASANPQLKHIVALMTLTRVRQRDLLEAKWEHFDLDQGVWTIPSESAGSERRVDLPREAIDLLRAIPVLPKCPFVLANPVTRKPYRSFTASWETARLKAGLADVEIDDLRFCNPLNESTTASTGGPDQANAGSDHSPADAFQTNIIPSSTGERLKAITEEFVKRTAHGR